MVNIWKVVALLGINSQLRLSPENLATRAKIVIKSAFKENYIKILVVEKQTYLVAVNKNWQDLLNSANKLF
jgi:hypothetical protein